MSMLPRIVEPFAPANLRLVRQRGTTQFVADPLAVQRARNAEQRARVQMARGDYPVQENKQFQDERRQLGECQFVLAQKEAAIAALQAQNQELEKQTMANAMEIARLQNQIIEIQDENRTLEEKNDAQTNQLQQLQTQLSTKENDQLSVERQLAVASATAGTNSSRADALASQLKSCIEEKKSLQTRVESGKSAVQKIETLLEGKKEELDNIQKQLSVALEKQQTVETQRKQVARELAQAQREKNQAKAAQDAAEKKHDIVKKERDTAQMAKQQCDLEKKQLQQAAQAAQEAKADAEARASELDARIGKLRAKFAEDQKACEARIAKESALQAQLQLMTTLNKQLVAEKKDADARVAASVNEKSQLQVRVADLEAKIQAEQTPPVLPAQEDATQIVKLTRTVEEQQNTINNQNETIKQQNIENKQLQAEKKRYATFFDSMSKLIRGFNGFAMLVNSRVQVDASLVKDQWTKFSVRADKIYKSFNAARRQGGFSWIDAWTAHFASPRAALAPTE